MNITKRKLINVPRVNYNQLVNNEEIHKLPSVNEWQNSVYSFNKNLYFETNIKDKLIHSILTSYFNSKPNNYYIDNTKYKRISLKRIFISKPEIKHNINNVMITVYNFNKQKSLFFNKLKKINKLFINKVTFDKYKKQINNNSLVWGFFNKFVNNGVVAKYLVKFDKKRINSFFFNMFKLVKSYDVSYKKSIIINRIAKKVFRNKLKKNYLYKYYTTLLYMNNLRYSSNNMLGLVNILNKLYNKKVILNIITLKYLFLDNSIILDAIVRKVNDRKKRILKVMRKALKLSVKGKLHPLLLIPSEKKVNKNIFSNDTMLIYKNIFKNYISEKYNFVFDNLKYKYFVGYRVQGSGRLTKRLTASRSILKRSNKGGIKNIYSSYQKLSTVMLRGHLRSNLQYLNINSKNRNGSFGIKSWLNSY